MELVREKQRNVLPILCKAFVEMVLPYEAREKIGRSGARQSSRRRYLHKTTIVILSDERDLRPESKEK